MKPRDMGVFFDECAQRAVPTRVHLDRPFDIAKNGGLEYGIADLAALVRETSGWLAAAGVSRGDRVAVVKDNHWDYDLLACAAIRLGAVPAQISAELPAGNLAVLIDRLRPALLVTTATILSACTESDVDLGARADRVLTLDTPVPGRISLGDVLGATPPAPRPRMSDDPLVINHTSGTTGVPKLVVHSTRTLIGTLARLESRRIPILGVRSDDTVTNANCYAHARTFCWTASILCLAPRDITILTSSDPDACDPVLRARPPTIMEALPATLVRLRPLLDRLDNPFRDTRLFMNTYDAIHPPTVRHYLNASRRRYPLWMQGWGQTETGPLTFRFLTRGSVAATRGSNLRDVGKPIPIRTRLRVVDPASLRPVPAGTTGLILARTKATCLGYLSEERRWAHKWSGNWFDTGDLGRRRRDGGVLLLDRQVDHASELSCLETEDTLEDRLPGALECVLLTPENGTPLPVIVTEDGHLDRLRWETAISDLPTLDDPVVTTWQKVPRTATGKVRRRDLMRTLLGREVTGTEQNVTSSTRK